LASNLRRSRRTFGQRYLTTEQRLTQVRARGTTTRIGARIIRTSNIAPRAIRLPNLGNDVTGELDFIQATADGKNTIYRQATAPSGGTYAVGDLWFDTDDDNKIYRNTVAGSTPTWAGFTLGTNAVANLNASVITAGTLDASVITVSNLNAGNIVTGTLSGITISGNTVSGNTITGGTIAIGSGNTIFKADTNGIYLGNATFGSAPFRVTPAGALTATNASITGSITSSSISGGTISGTTITGSTLTTAASGNRVHVNTNDITLYYNADNVSNILFSGPNVYTSLISSDGSLIIRGLGSSAHGSVRVGRRPSLLLGTYIYGTEGVEIAGGTDSQSAGYANLIVSGPTLTQTALSFMCQNTHIQLRTANNDSKLYIRRANDTAYADMSLGVLINNGAGVIFAGSSVGGGAANQMGMSWANPNILGTVDNAVSAVLGTVSDRRIKTNIETFTSGLSELQNLRVVKYNPYVVTEFTEDGPTVSGASEQTMIGLIADEVEQVAPWLVQGTASKRELQSVNYALITPLLINAVKELDKRLSDLENNS
jgi:hypothetical protein